MSSRLDAKRVFILLLHEASFKNVLLHGKESTSADILTFLFTKTVVYGFEIGPFS
jgi:hypothetical protein